MSPHDQALVQRIRAACAAEFMESVDFPFFSYDRMPGESVDDMLLRRFREEQKSMPGASEEAVIDVLIFG